MANGRFISTTVAIDKRLNEMSIEAEYLFLKTIPHLDRDGLILADAPLLWAKVCPRRPEVMGMIPGIYQEWIAAELATLYETGEGDALHFRSFTKNQAGMRYDREGASRIDSPPGMVRTKTGLVTQFSGGNPHNAGPTPELVRTLAGVTPLQGQGEVQVQVEVEGKDQVQEKGQNSSDDGDDSALPKKPSLSKPSDPSLTAQDINLVTEYEKAFVSFPSMIQIESLDEMAATYGAMATKTALGIAAGANVFKLSYVQGILRKQREDIQNPRSTNGYDKPTQAHATTTHDLGDIAR